MNFEIKRNVLLKALQKFQGFTKEGHAIAVLSNVLIDAYENGIQITATNLEITLRNCYPAEVKKTGCVTLPSKKLFELVKELADETVEFRGEKGFVNVNCGKFKSRISSLPVESFPEFPKIDATAQAKIQSSLLKKMISNTIFSVDESHISFNFLMFESDGEKVTMVSTDGHRLSIVENEISLDKFKIQLTKQSAIELFKILCSLEEVIINIGNNHASFEKNDLNFVVRLQREKFPNYESILSSVKGDLFQINRETLVSAIKRVSLCSDDLSNMVKFGFEDELTVTSNSEGGEASEKVEIVGSSEKVIGLNAKFVLEALKVCENEIIEFYVEAENKPALIIDNGKYVIMSMRVK